MFRKRKEERWVTTQRDKFVTALHEAVPELIVRIERIPQGSMEDYMVFFEDPASLLSASVSYEYLTAEKYGNGQYFFSFVDETMRPLPHLGSSWHLMATKAGEKVTKERLLKSASKEKLPNKRKESNVGGEMKGEIKEEVAASTGTTQTDTLLEVRYPPTYWTLL